MARNFINRHVAGRCSWRPASVFQVVGDDFLGHQRLGVLSTERMQSGGRLILAPKKLFEAFTPPPSGK